MVDRLHDLITGHELPDAPPAPAGRPARRPAGGGGAAPVLAGGGGRAARVARRARRLAGRVFRIAGDTGREFGHLLTVVKAAELLDLVDTPRRLVVLTPAGRAFAAADADAAQGAAGGPASSTSTCSSSSTARSLAAPGHRLGEAFALELIALRLPAEDFERTFQTLVGWARYGDLFAYDEVAEELSLRDAS